MVALISACLFERVPARQKVLPSISLIVPPLPSASPSPLSSRLPAPGPAPAPAPPTATPLIDEAARRRIRVERLQFPAPAPASAPVSAPAPAPAPAPASEPAALLGTIAGLPPPPPTRTSSLSPPPRMCTPTSEPQTSPAQDPPRTLEQNAQPPSQATISSATTSPPPSCSTAPTTAVPPPTAAAAAAPPAAPTGAQAAVPAPAAAPAAAPAPTATGTTTATATATTAPPPSTPTPQDKADEERIPISWLLMHHLPRVALMSTTLNRYVACGKRSSEGKKHDLADQPDTTGVVIGAPVLVDERDAGAESKPHIASEEAKGEEGAATGASSSDEGLSPPPEATPAASSSYSAVAGRAFGGLKRFAKRTKRSIKQAPVTAGQAVAGVAATIAPETSESYRFCLAANHTHTNPFNCYKTRRELFEPVWMGGDLLALRSARGKATAEEEAEGKALYWTVDRDKNQVILAVATLMTIEDRHTFSVVSTDDALLFHSKLTGQYVGVSPSGKLTLVHCTEQGENFKLNAKVALKARDGRFLSLNSSTRQLAAVARRKKGHTLREMALIQLEPGGRCSISSFPSMSGRRYWCAQEDGTITATSHHSDSDSELFHIEHIAGLSYALKTSFGCYANMKGSEESDSDEVTEVETEPTDTISVPGGGGEEEETEDVARDDDDDGTGGGGVSELVDALKKGKGSSTLGHEKTLTARMVDLDDWCAFEFVSLTVNPEERLELPELATSPSSSPSPSLLPSPSPSGTPSLSPPTAHDDMVASPSSSPRPT
eukprot:TRINITY_DN976_c0_g1_i4.p1 TRINITY_DN976_c0_g1~~TRINITY_DN976_c0_g1_i4.p1  ORF type:complete len:775 (+),score=187.25 TRINITY_DN976_c0_g1_i4:565-2889(+)